MKKIRAWGFAVLMTVVLCACGEEQELADISTEEGDGYTAIIWEERTYVPFCVVSKNDCGELIGYVNGDTGDRVCEYKDYPSNKWIANYLTVDGGDLSIMKLTCLPFLVHDSVLLKQIEDVAIEKILELYNASEKQVFIALDKVWSYSERSQAILKNNRVLQLGTNGDELFGRSWSKK